MAEGNIGLGEPSTITKSLRTVTQNINSSVVHQEVMTLGGANSSLEVAAVRAAAPSSTDYGLVVRIAGGPSSAVDLLTRANQGVGNSSVTDYWNMRVVQSTATDLLGRMSQGPGNSSAGDAWLTRSAPASTLWASSAGFHFDSSGALLVAASFTGSTVVTVARTVGNSSAVDYMPVRLVDSSGTGFLAPGLEYTDGSTASTLAAPGLSFINGSNTTMRMVGTTQPLPVALTDSSNAVVKAGDSANNALRVNVVAGAAGGSTIVTVSRQIGNSSAADYMPIRVVDSSGTGYHGPANPIPMAVTDSSNAVVKAGDSANNALRVNVVAGAAGGSTIVTISRQVGNSSAADYMPIRIVDSSGTGYHGPANPLPVQVVSGALSLQSTTILVNIGTAGGSTTLQSSVAAQSHKVFAFSVTSTVVATSSCAFLSSAGTEKWGLLLGSGSSGVSGANLAISPPGFLFRTAAGEALGFSATSSGLYRVSISYFTEA